jgi:hypothetical protein
VSKYEKKYRLESFREQMIQKIQMENKCSREYAVRYYDYNQQVISHTGLKITSGLLYMFGAHKFIQATKKDIPLMSKSFVKIPVLATGFYIGKVLYEKLVYHYLNPDNSNTSHIWDLDYKYQYNVKFDDVDTDVPLTPYDRMKKEMVNNLDTLNVEGEKVYKRLSKDRNDFYYMFGKVRNLENIIYLDPEDVKKSKNSVELQMKIDSVKPTLKTTGDINKHIESIHNNAEEYKYFIENSRNFRSIKDKFLGLPFMLKRHQQLPTPSRGTWQFDVYEHMFGEAYDKSQGLPENEEKINKFNYHLFLHPSVIAKFDTNSEEFDMYLRKLNMESLTVSEQREKQREYFCKKILPVLNLTDNKEAGFDFANYVVNKQKGKEYGHYLHEQYSGQKEEELFRQAEEAKFVNKNQPFVERVSYSTIDKSKIGIRAKEMEELLGNPTATKKMRRALEFKYNFYEPAKIVDIEKANNNISNYYNTVINREIDTTSADFKIEDLHAAQYDKGEGGDNPEEEALMSHHVNFPVIPGVDTNNNPYGITGKSQMFYSPDLDWNDYAPDVKAFQNFISPKNSRFQMFANLHTQILDKFYYRNFNSPEFADRIGYVVPYIDYKNEELKQRVLFRSNFHRFLDNHKVRDSDKEKLEFLEYKSMEDSYAISDDVTEEELDQALFESTYNKPYWESEEYRGNFFLFYIRRTLQEK